MAAVALVLILPGAPPPPRGVQTVTIRGVRSGFPARPAVLYLPPDYTRRPTARFPVLELLAGEPGEPDDWVTQGDVVPMMDAFAAAHHGVAPVVVMPDDTGRADTDGMLCMDSRRGNAETYLATDVPDWVRARLRVTGSWAVAGLSYGGSCALQLAVRHPRLFATFLDMSGEAVQTLGDVAGAIASGFGGDARAFRAVNPLDILRRTRLPASQGWLVAGADDTGYRPQAVTVAAACRAAGMPVRLTILPGGHDWGVWTAGLRAALPWLTGRMGISGK